MAEADDFLLATIDPDGWPHVVPVLGVWLEEAVCFVTFQQSRKARNLVRNNGCAVTVPGHDVDLVLEGAAHLVRNAARLQKIADLFPAKYPWWHPFVRDGEFYDPADTAVSDPRHVYAVEPAQVFAFVRRKGSAPPAGASRCSDRTWSCTPVPPTPENGATGSSGPIGKPSPTRSTNTPLRLGHEAGTRRVSRSGTVYRGIA